MRKTEQLEIIKGLISIRGGATVDEIAKHARIRPATLPMRLQELRSQGLFIRELKIISADTADTPEKEVAVDRPHKTFPRRTAGGPTKAAIVLRLLCRKRGAKIEELMNATGWSKGSVQSRLSSLRRNGQQIERIGRAADHFHIIGTPSPAQ